MRLPLPFVLFALVATACASPAPTKAQRPAPATTAVISSAPVEAAGAAASEQRSAASRSVPSDEGRRRALLVGIGDYAPAAEGQRSMSPLYGPPADLAMMTDVLTERGFAAADIAVLRDEQATRQGILDAIDAWIEGSEPGDHLVFYYSGHGSQVPTDAADEPDGRAETLVPYDAGLGMSDIVDKTLRQRWNRALDVVRPEGGPQGSLTIIQDNCNSGSGSRDVYGPVARRVEMAPEAEFPEGEVGPPPHTRGALVFSAAKDFQPAMEDRIDGGMTKQGVFTTAFVRALRSTPQGAPARLIHEKTVAFVDAMGSYAQLASFEGPEGEPLFGEPLAPGGGQGVAVVAVDGEEVTLAGGVFSNLNGGAELVRFLTSTEQGTSLADSTVRLRVREAQGPARSTALVTAGVASSVRVGDLFRITKPVLAPSEPLRVWLPPAASDAEIRAYDSTCPAGATCTARPETAPDLVMLPGGGNGDGGAVARGPVGSGALVYRPLPPPSALRDALADRLGAVPEVEVTDSPDGADYWLVGEMEEGTPSYRWARRGVVTTGDTLHVLPKFDGAVRGTAADGRFLADVLKTPAKVKAYASMVNPPHTGFPVRLLGLLRLSDSTVVRPDSTGRLRLPVRRDDRRCPPMEFRGEPNRDYRDPAANEECFVLAVGATAEDLVAYAADEYASSRRWGYAFTTNRVGEACLLYPYAPKRQGDTSPVCSAAVENGDNRLELDSRQNLVPRLTTDGETVHVFAINEASVRFAMGPGSVGRNTYYLITTEIDQPQPAPHEAFQWEGVKELGRRRNPEFAPPPEEVPWSIDHLTVDVYPREQE